ncbi:MAG TPA: LysM peptidoglycan-binding domain-containing protein [Streptosporangiaceae bacterium]
MAGAPQPTTLQELIDLLKANIGVDPDGRQFIDLSAALFTEAGVFVAYLARTTLRITQRQGTTFFDPQPDHVALRGTAEVFAGVEYDVEWTGRVPARTPLLDMRAAPVGPGWTFGGSFPGLPGTVVSERKRLVTRDSFFYDLTFVSGDSGDPPRFVVSTFDDPEAGLCRGVTFSGTLDATRGALSPIARYLTDPSRLRLSGSIQLRPAAHALIDLAASVSGPQPPKLAELTLRLRAADTTRDRSGGGSLASLAGAVHITGLDPLTLDVPMLRGDAIWPFRGVFAPGQVTLGSGLSQLTEFLGGQPVTLPPGLDALDWLSLTEVLVGVRPPRDGAGPDVLTLLGITVSATRPWELPIPGVSIAGARARWQILNPLSDASLLGMVAGTIVFGSEPQAPRLNVEIRLPDPRGPLAREVAIEANLDTRYPLKIGDVFRHFTGGALDFKLDVTQLDLLAVPARRTLFVYTVVKGDSPFRVPLLDFQQLNFTIDYAPNALAGSVTAAVAVAGADFAVTADNPGPGHGWRFFGGMKPASKPLTLQAFVDALSDRRWPDLPANLGAIELRRLFFSFDTGTGDFAFDGVIGWPFHSELLGLELDLEAELALSSARTEAGRTWAGLVRGALVIDDFRVGAVYRWDVEKNKTIAFEIAFRKAVLTCIFSKIRVGNTTNTILRANLGGVSFGDLVEFLVGLVDPQLGFRLSTPWDILYDLKFDALWLEVNMTTGDIGARYDFGALDLVLLRLDWIQLTYVKRAGRRTVEISIGGEFVGAEYGDDDPLSWDMLNDPAPSPPGAGEKLLDLRYLAFGQNVALRDDRSFMSVLEVIEALKEDFTPVDGDADPLTQLPALKFSGDGRWLIGADLTIMSAVSLAGVFCDPALYGLRVALAGPRVKSLAGLEFEILYKKVTDTIGVYQMELTLPDAMRQLQFGAVSVTVPVIGLDIYTNGQFRLDFGFPVDRDFTHSFCIQGGPFVGYGGFYVAVLDGQTSERVPPIANGTFSPVVEFGIGISAGVGRTIDKGMLKAGATLTLEAIVEGVLAWFNPNEQSLPSDFYYYIQGTAAITGKIYGSIDFAVVKASISIVATAAVTLTIAAYEPIEVRLVVLVEVSASIQVLFITIAFSFSASLDLSFEIGGRGTAPWLPTEREPVPLRLGGQRSRHHHRAPRAIELLRAMPWEPVFDWTPRWVLPDAPAPVELLLAPTLTPAIASSVLGGAGLGAAPATQIVMTLFARTSTPVAARHADEVRLLDVAVADAAGAPLNVLAKGLLLWAIGSLPATVPGEVTADHLAAIAEFLADRRNRDETFTYLRIRDLIEKNFVLRVQAADEQDPPVQAALFPMIPEITMTPDGREPVSFWRHHCAGPAYRELLETYYDQLQVGDLPPRGRAGRDVPGFGCDDEGPDYEAVSTTLFCDWFAAVTQQAVQAAADLLTEYPYEATGAESLRDVVTEFAGPITEHLVRVGDTPGTVAARFGLTLNALRLANPSLAAARASDRLPHGSTVRVDAGPSVAALAAANGDYPLRAGGTISVVGVRCQVRAGQTLASIVRDFGVPDPADLFDPKGHNAANPELLRAGAELRVPALDYTVEQADVEVPAEAFDRIAATFYTRTRPAVTDQERQRIDWYLADISAANPAFTGRIEVPVAELGDDGQVVETGRTTRYVVRPGDTPEGVAAVFQLLQLAPGDAAFLAFRAAIRPQPPIGVGTVLRLPAFTTPVRAGDTFLSAATTFAPQAPAAALAVLARANATNDIFALRAVLELPELRHSIRPDETLGGLAARFDLTIEELAEGAADDEGILAPYSDSGRRLTVPDVARRAIDTLAGDLVAFGSFNTLSTTMSRYLLHGMRTPVPDGPPVPNGPRSPLWGLYDVAGQQFPAPAGPPAAYGVGFAKAATGPWLCFEPDCASELTVTLSADYLQRAPSLELDPLTVTGPAPMPPYDEVGPRFALEQQLPWQPAAEVRLPGPTGPVGTAGGPSLWPFPDTLLRQLAVGLTGVTATTEPFELVATRALPAGGTEDVPLAHYAWAAAIPLRISPARTDAGDPVPGAYQVGGAEQEGREQLLAAWQFLEAAGTSDDRLYLLHRPLAPGPNPKGLASDVLAPEGTFLLRTNLSTQTHSGRAAQAPGDSGEYFARIDAPAAFLKYVWEASVTGTGGFVLRYQGTGGDLPPELFAAGGTATVWALLLVARQGLGVTPDRRLLAFNNCAVLGDNLDASAVALAARPEHPEPADLRRVASLRPGVAGFGLARYNPVGPTGPTGMTQQLHSLVGYRVEENQWFTESHEGLPVGPDDAVPAWMHLAPRPPHSYWTYQQLVPLAQFGVANASPSSAALPPRENDPYRGITGPREPDPAQLSRARLGFAYYDVHGNETACTTPLPDIEVPVGYTDDLIGVAAWPGAGFDYRFEPLAGPAGAMLSTRLSLQVERYVPGEGNAAETAARTASADAGRYRQIFYQVHQPDLDCALTSNLGRAEVDPGDLTAMLSWFVTGAYLFASTASTLRQHVVPTTAGETLGDLAQRLSVTVAALAAANPDAPGPELFPGTYVRPHIMAAPAMNTLVTLAERVVGRSGVPAGRRSCNDVSQPDATCGPEPGPLPPASWVDVAADNLRQPLGPGITLRTARRTSLELREAPRNSLAGVAAWLGCAAYAEVVDPGDPKGPPIEVGLIVENWTETGLIAEGVELVVQGVSYRTPADATFRSVYDYYREEPQSLPITRADLAAAIQEVAGIFVPSARVAYAQLVVPRPSAGAGPAPSVPTFSLADIDPAAGDVALLATYNREVAGFFAAGSSLLLGWSCCKAGEGSTLETLAVAAGVTLPQLADHNALTALGDAVELAVPDLVQLRDPAACWCTAAPRPDDSLAALASRFGTTPAALAAVNRELPGVFRRGAEVTFDGRRLAALALDSLQSLWQRFASPRGFDEFVVELAPQAGVYRRDGALVVPLPAVPGTGDRTPPVETLAAELGVGAAALLRANRSLEGVLREGAVFHGPDADGPHLVVSAFDTVDTVIRRGREAWRVEVDVDRLLEWNRGRGGLLGGGATLLLPPNPGVVGGPFAAVVPPTDARTPEDAMIFPVEVSVELTRWRGRVHPDFVDTVPVFRASSRLAPQTGGGGTLSLDTFAASFEEAFASFRLKCAVAAGERPGELYAVNFGASGVSTFAVDAGGPAYYAVTPVSTDTLDATVRFPRYVSGEGLCGTVTRSFEDVDLDAWLRQFLAAVDLFLTPPFAVPAFAMGSSPAPGGEVRGSVPTAPVRRPGPVGFASSRLQPARLTSALGPPPDAAGCTGPTADGPTDYSRVVDAKERLAAALRNKVQPIVEAPGCTGPVAMEAAQETLYQQALVRLSSAYDVSAVVQFPVDVRSPAVTPPGPTAAGPPRVSGKVMPVVHTVAEDLGTAAGAFDVPAPFLAAVVGELQGLLRTRAVIEGQTVEPDDTLVGVARRLGVDVERYWTSWAPFIERIADQLILVAGAALSVSRLERTVAAGESLVDQAEFFGRDPVSVGRANADRAGVVRQQALALPPLYPAAYVVGPADSLISIAAGLSVANPEAPPLSVDGLCDLARERLDLLAPSALHMAELLPELSLSTAKVSLGRIGSPQGPPPWLSFLLTVEQASRQNTLLLELDYRITEIEHRIRNVPGAGAYQASSWLTLVLPFGSPRGGIDAGVRTAIPQVQVPISLRAYPQPPLLTGHSGLPSRPDAPDFADARLWDYRFDVRSLKAAQDTDHLRVVFGELQSARAPATASSLVAWLAAFVEAAPVLSVDLARLNSLAPGHSDEVAARAVQALSFIAAGVADGLSEGAGADADVAGGDVYAFQMTSTTDGTQLQTLSLTPEPPGPPGPIGLAWPVVYVQSPTANGTGPDAGFLRLGGGEGRYTYPPGITADRPQTHRFRFEGRDVIVNGTGRGAMAVSRNDRLIVRGPLGPSGPPGPVPTRDDFIYRAPYAEFVDPLIPLIDNDAAIWLARPGEPRRGLCRHLLRLFELAIGVTPQGAGPGRWVEVLCSYGFHLAGEAGDELLGLTPLRLAPGRLVTPTGVLSYATELADSIARAAQAPASGLLVFEVSVFTGTPALRPVLRLRDVRLSVDAIDWRLSGPAGCGEGGEGG